MAAAKPKTRDDLVFIDVDDEALVFDSDVVGIHHLNPMAKLVYQLCDGKATVKETASVIAEAFGAPLADVERDVRATVREFRDWSLLRPTRRDRALESASSGAEETDERDKIRLDAKPST